MRARLRDRMDSTDFEVLSCAVPVRPLDCLELSPAFIKLDVQGFEHEALLGLRFTLRRTRPILLIETPDDAVRQHLRTLGYGAFSYLPRDRRLVTETERRLNTVFVGD